MLRTQITTAYSPSGQPISVPPEFRAGVERANWILESEMLPTRNFDIEAHWKFVNHTNNRIAVLLDLTTSYEGSRVGITGYPMDADDFLDDPRIRSVLNRPTWSFTTLLSYINKTDVKHSRERLQSSLFTGV